MGKVSELVWLYVKRHPYLQEALERKVVNYSALARKINKELKVSEPAVKAALMRISERLAKRKVQAERKVLAVLKKSNLVLKSKVAVLISLREPEGEFIAKAQGPSGWVSVVQESDLPKIKKKGRVEVQRNLDLVSIVSPREIEKVPGVIAYLFSLLAAENINIVHMFSAYRDTVFVVRDVDTAKTYQILSEKIR